MRVGKYIGQTDYVGPCDTTNDPDCDRFYDTKPGTTKWGSDNCPGVYNPAQFPALDANDDGLPNDGVQDQDKDGIPDYCDPKPNCPRTVDQGDDDNDGICNGLDSCPCSPLGNGIDASGDPDKDGACDTCTGGSSFCQNFCNLNPPDTCPSFSNGQYANTNYLAESANDARVLGDECEPIPVPLVKTTPQITSNTLLAFASGGSGTGNWAMEKRQIDSRLDGFTITPTGSRGAPKSSNPNGTPGSTKTFTIPNTDYRSCIYDAGINCTALASHNDILASPSKLRAAEGSTDYWHRIQVSRRTGTSTWTPIAPNSADGSILYDFSSTKREFRWDWTADFSVWTSTWGQQSGLQGPSDPTADNKTRVWAHARIDEPGMAFTDNLTGYHPRLSSPTTPAEQLANHYEDGRFLARTSSQKWTSIPMYKPSPWIYDRVIEAVTNPGLPVMADRVGPRYRADILMHMGIGAGLAGNVGSLQDDATTHEAASRVSSTLLAQKEGGSIFVNAAEVDAGLGLNHPSLYVLSPDGGTIADIVRFRGGQFVGTGDRGWYAKQAIGSTPSLEAQQDASDAVAVQSSAASAAKTNQLGTTPTDGKEASSALQPSSKVASDQATLQVTTSAASSPASRQGFVTAYTRARNKVFVVGGTSSRTGERLNDIWMFRQSVWQQVTTDFAVGRPLAATYAFRNDRLWIVDEVLVGRVLTARLVTIEPETGAYQVLGSWARTGAFNDVWLSLDRDGSVLLTSSSNSSPQHVVTRLVFSTSGPAVEQQFRGTGELAFAPVVDPTGYAFAVVPGAKVMPLLARRTALGGTPASWSSLAGTL